MVAHPSSSPLPNTGPLSLLQIQLFSQVPSDVAFYSPALRVLLPPPTKLCFLVPQTVSALPPPSPLPGTNLQSQGLSAQPPPKHLGFW